MTRVADLTGAELDLWVAKAAGVDAVLSDVYPDGSRSAVTYYSRDHDGFIDGRGYCPSSHWSDGGPLLAKLPRIRIQENDETGFSVQSFPDPYCALPIYGYGETILIAAMRALVASKFGETVTDQEAPCVQ